MRVGHGVLLLVVRGALSDVHQAELPAIHDEHVLLGAVNTKLYSLLYSSVCNRNREFGHGRLVVFTVHCSLYTTRNRRQEKQAHLVREEALVNVLALVELVALELPSLVREPEGSDLR